MIAGPEPAPDAADAEPDRDADADVIAELLLRLESVMVRHEATVARRLGLDPAEHLCLILLDRLGPLSITTIGEWTGLSTAAASRMVGRLEAAGRVERFGDPENGRSVLAGPAPASEHTARRDQVLEPLRRALADTARSGADRDGAVVADWLVRVTEQVHRHTRELDDAAWRERERQQHRATRGTHRDTP